MSLNKCDTCQSRGAPRGQYPTLSRPMSDEPFQTVVSDFSGQLGPPTGKQRYRYFVVFGDQVTKWPIVVPVKAPTADELIKALKTALMPQHGYMEQLVSYQGGAYVKKEFKEYCTARDIKQNLVAKGNHKATRTSN